MLSSPAHDTPMPQTLTTRRTHPQTVAEATESHFKSREHETRNFLTPNSFSVIRLDGRAFHSYCRGLQQPADRLFMGHMDMVALALVKQLSGVRLSYIQSDEISLLLTDWRQPTDEETEPTKTEFMFGGNIQKLVSISAAIASTTLNALRYGTVTDKVALFDARAFSLDTREETVDYFAWRQHDALVNTVSMTAGAHFSSRELHGLSTAGRFAKLVEAGVDPDVAPAGFRGGRVTVFEERPGTATYLDKRTNLPVTVNFVRREAVAVPAPRFVDDDSLIPAAR